MDKYRELINIFSEVLEKSKDYHIAYIYQVGYVSLIGLLSKEEQSASMIVDEIFPRRRVWRKVYCVTGAGNGSMNTRNYCHGKIMTISVNSTVICRTICRSSTDRIF